MIIEQATIDDLPVILAMRQEASDWLAKQGINQWAAAWPTPEAQSERILSSIRAGETWMVRDDDGATAATVALDSFSDPKLWTPEEQRQPSMYLHRLIVRRKYSGLGTDVIEWACKRAGELGNHWVRIDVWTDNIGLHRYYEQRGFRHVRTLDLSDYPSGALFQRKATDRHQIQPDAVITELAHDLPTPSQPDTSARRVRITLVPSIA
ncbi:acetyltransferase (GNAT) family protein [Kribbella sp. VKM Ac-2527]|uniref:Acetyltransferase (GNAT) family protein n=1 Tax=Kribbella caucasensis TaxID=2512215 RepID=A0A4R6KA86_9ACTN|nr:GNAT family N-acetyltransferase [Kribbella sp. VKM Ac-2527]TDO45882.1 acetyltransferase (GNAT) family protein [Kribbella sp. VKM Ac-2527]